MKKSLLLCFALCLASIGITHSSANLSTTSAGSTTDPVRREIGNLVLDGIPDIPNRISERSAQYQNVRAAAFVDWQPNGKGMLISTRFGDATQLHYVAAPGGDRRQITFLREPITSGWYSPRKDQHGFVFSMDSGGAEFYQLYWFDEDTGKYSMITDGKSRNENFLWSNHGDRAAFNSTKRNGKDLDIYLINGIDASSVRLLKQVDGEWQVIDWSKDDSQLLIRHYISANESYLYTLDVTSGQLKEINPTNNTKKISYGSASFARNGNGGIYYVSDEDSEFQRLSYYDPTTNKSAVITGKLDWDVESIQISPDGLWRAYTTNEGGLSKLYLESRQFLDIGAHKVVEIPESLIKLPKGVISNLKFDPESTRLGFTLNSPQTPAEAYSLDLKTREVIRWTFSEAGGLNPKSFVAPELIEYPTFDSVNGKPRMIPAFYYKPSIDTKKPLPVIISIHGGPESQATATYSATYQSWVNELGAAVLVPNVRGSSGYGKSYLLLDNGFQREDSIKDIGKLIDWIATRPELDAKRIAVIGGSYGGYMSLASLTHFNDRLKCGVDTVGISNFVTFLESTQEYRRNLRRPEYGDERDPKMREFLLAISPLTNAKNITKPLLVVQGLNDPRVPVTEAEQIVKTVRGNNGVAWYLLGKDEGHGFRKKANQEFYLNSVSLFFEEYLLK